jgi:hypothetical protein
LVNQKVMARSREGVWVLAEIMEVRKEELNSEDEEDLTKEESILSLPDMAKHRK